MPTYGQECSKTPNDMELILGAAVIILLLLILGFGIDTVIFGIFWVFVALTALSELFFLYCIARLIFSKKRTGRFVHIGKKKKDGYDTPFYTVEGIDGEPLPNVFPAEVVMKNRIYKPDSDVKLRLDAGKKFVYDRNARITIILGAPLCAALLGLLYAIMLLVLDNYP